MSRPLKRRFQNDDEKKEKYNSTISSSIADIIRFSLDDQFRSKCFQLMQVNNTNDFQLAIKNKLDSLINPRSGTSPTLQKRPSFHNEETERSSNCPPGINEMIPQVNAEADEVEKVGDLENIEMLDSLIQNKSDSHIDEIVNKLKMTNIMMEENIKEKYCMPGTSGTASKTYIGTEEIKKGITSHNVNCNEDELTEKIQSFWPTEDCFNWDSSNSNIQENGPTLLQEEINDFELNETDTDWE
ncbi:uncharacterized protein [Halyomorpha halys]|uniref:uncharacterized protein isoform X1 n=1 Tax=Halyomorpha halys TaxID=286706 RepID=UPI0006D50E2C|nr:uncharacterized protein LOC106677778 isoform X1 [Halyomorpha halys]